MVHPDVDRFLRTDNMAADDNVSIVSFHGDEDDWMPPIVQNAVAAMHTDAADFMALDMDVEDEASHEFVDEELPLQQMRLPEVRARRLTGHKDSTTETVFTKKDRSSNPFVYNHPKKSRPRFSWDSLKRQTTDSALTTVENQNNPGNCYLY